MRRRPAWDHEGSRHARGYGAAWVRVRAWVMRRDDFMCQPCLRKGRPTPATAVDHVVPRARGGDDDPSNLQAICDVCHEEKSVRERGMTYHPKVTIGTDGWPK